LIPVHPPVLTATLATAALVGACVTREDNGLASPGLWICLRPDQSGRRAGAPPKFEERRGRSVLFSEHRLVVLASSPLVSLIHLPANQLVIADDV